MDNKQNTNSEQEILHMIDDTSQLFGKYNANAVSSSVIAAKNSNALTNNVEFWQWMQRNYSTSGIFDSTTSIQKYISQGAGKEGWVYKQLQGKGYEWDWMTAQRNNPLNIFNTYDAGDVANRAASDVTRQNLLTGQSQEYQMKAYISNANPDLHNTPKDMTVVTNAEKADIVRHNGYADVEDFKDARSIQKSTDHRMKQIKNGKASPTYHFKNVAGTMAKAGLIGCVIGIGTETVASYKRWKNGEITDEEYITEVIKSGGDVGVTSGATAGIMIPVSAAISAAGASTIITIPIAMVVSSAVNKIVAPCFGRGDYQKYLSKAKYYQHLEMCYSDFISSVEDSANSFSQYIDNVVKQNQQYENLKQTDRTMNQKLKNLYDEI